MTAAALALGAGLVAGIVFFGGLYWTLGRVASGRGGPAFLVVGFIARLALVAALLVPVVRNDPLGLAVALPAMLAVRELLRWRVRPDAGSPGR